MPDSARSSLRAKTCAKCGVKFFKRVSNSKYCINCKKGR